MLKVGIRLQRVKLQPLSTPELATLELSRDLVKKFGLQGQTPVNLRFNKEPALLELGPTIGVFTTVSKGRNLFPSIYREFFRVAQEEGIILYLFRSKDVDIKRMTIKGFKYQHKWLRQRFPFPDVVYDQIRSRKKENSTQVIKVKKVLQHSCSGYFNLGFMNKWQIHQLLTKYPGIAKYLPPTVVYSGVDTILKMLKSNPVVYLKPSDGSLGQGILKIKHYNEKFYWQWAARRRPVTKIFRSVKEMEPLLSCLVKGKTYIVQQGIQLLTVNDRPADIRILMQKDGDGQWQETHRFAKVALGHGVATNVAMGGMVIEVSALLQEAIDKYGVDPVQVESNIIDLQREICKAMDEGGTGLGEMGIDVGIDQKGRVWLIEANAKYSRHVFPRPLRYLSIRRPLSFAKWLTGW